MWGDKDLFIVSSWWMENFMKRYGLSLRRKTTYCSTRLQSARNWSPLLYSEVQREESMKNLKPVRCSFITQCLDERRINTCLGQQSSRFIFFYFNRRVLAWDSFECHMMETVENAISKFNIDQVIVPGGCTKYTSTGRLLEQANQGFFHETVRRMEG